MSRRRILPQQFFAVVLHFPPLLPHVASSLEYVSYLKPLPQRLKAECALLNHAAYVPPQ